MYLLPIVFASLSATGLVMLARAAHSAPEGYQDATGFHALNPGDLTATMPVELTYGLDDMFFLDRQMASQPWR